MWFYVILKDIHEKWTEIIQAKIWRLFVNFIFLALNCWVSHASHGWIIGKKQDVLNEMVSRRRETPQLRFKNNNKTVKESKPKVKYMFLKMAPMTTTEM